MQTWNESAALTWVNLDLDTRAPIRRTVAPPQATSESRASVHRLPGSAVPGVASINGAATARSPTPRDWHASMEAAATAAVAKLIRGEGYRSLGPVEPGETDSSPPPSIFQQPKHRAGDIERDAVQGSTLVWHNDRCYTELRFPTIKDPNALVAAPNPPKCMQPLGKRKPRGDLFEVIEPP